jgi:hypothetical protein
MPITALLGKSVSLLDAHKVLMLSQLSLEDLKQTKKFSQPYFAIIVRVFECSLERSDQYKCIYFLLPHLKGNSAFCE